MATPSLQDGIDRAGSPVKLPWKPNAAPWTPEVVEREYTGWRQEQAAWHEGVALLNLSHHMYDLFIEGPDATRLLADVGANNFENFAIGQAKQYIPVTGNGYIVTDGILAREGENTYTLSGVPAAQHWVNTPAPIRLLTPISASRASAPPSSPPRSTSTHGPSTAATPDPHVARPVGGHPRDRRRPSHRYRPTEPQPTAVTRHPHRSASR